MAGVILIGAVAACGSSDRAPYVLVHGAWMGAWAWDDVAAGLREEGETVTVVELPAHGADASPISAATLDAYVERAEAELGERPVALVGHSMGGIVITEVAERNPEKIASLVYLAAFVPADGQSLLDLAMSDGDSHAGPALVVDEMEGTGGIPQEMLADIFCANCSAGALARLMERYRDEPLAPLATPLRTTAAGWGSVPKRYLYTTQDHAVSPALQQRMTAGVSFEATETLETDHSPMLSAPQRVIDALLEL